MLEIASVKFSITHHLTFSFVANEVADDLRKFILELYADHLSADGHVSACVLIWESFIFCKLNVYGNKWAVAVAVFTRATFTEIKWTKKCFYGYSANGNFPNYNIIMFICGYLWVNMCSVFVTVCDVCIWVFVCGYMYHM